MTASDNAAAQLAFAAATGGPSPEQWSADKSAQREREAIEARKRALAAKLLLAAGVGSRVRCTDAEAEGECGTVVAVTLSGGLKVRWDDGHDSWTHNRSAGLAVVVPELPAATVEALDVWRDCAGDLVLAVQTACERFGDTDDAFYRAVCVELQSIADLRSGE